MKNKFKLWLNVATFVAIGVVIYLARHDIAAAFEKMKHLNLWVLSLMIPAQFLAFFAIAKVYKSYFEAVGIKHLSVKNLLPAVIELNFVNHVLPSGGVSGFSYLTIHLKRYGISVAKSTLAQLARFVLAFVTFIGLLLIAVLLLAIEGKANRVIIFIATAMTTTILFGTLVMAYVIGTRTRIHGFATFMTKMVNRVVHFFVPSRPEAISLERVEKELNELHEDYLLLRNDFGKMKAAIYWAFIANVIEIGQIYIAFAAHGALINPGALTIAYAVATIAGLIAVLPGGLGVYEPLMVGVLITAGVANDLAVSATLVARVILLGMTLGVGYILYNRTLRRHGTDNTDS